MATYDPFSTKHIDYFQRSCSDLPRILTTGPIIHPATNMRSLWRIDGVGIIEKTMEGSVGKRIRLPNEDLIIGLYGCKIPLAFFVSGSRGGVMINLGTWIPKASKNTAIDVQQEILKTGLKSLYPHIGLVSVTTEQLTQFQYSGYVLGIPTAKPPHPLDNALPLDRLIRSLSGTTWSILVLAYPVDESVIINLRSSVINEIRMVQGAHQVNNAPSPLAEIYTKLLKTTLETLTYGLEEGMWRTGVYLLGNAESYYQLASLWRAIFSGNKSLSEPVRVCDDSAAGNLANNWAMPDVEGTKGPGFYQHPFEFQTPLTSSQLSAYIQLPQLETSGFAVTTVSTFDVIPPNVNGDKTICLGRIMNRTEITEMDYKVRLNNLTRHTFIPGVTGAGKTNTIFYMLMQATMLGVPFLVIEPAKTEYRKLLNNPDIGNSLHIFTPGNENISPFRLNPFEVPVGIPVGVHIDLLRSVFSMSFGMWTPLPQVLEQCLYGVYIDHGWDIATNNNYRNDNQSDSLMSYPTLTDLVNKVNDVVPQLGYDNKVTADIRAALLTRLNSLRTGGKGYMLDIHRSLSIEAILKKPTIMELDGMGDDDDKAFMMSLLFIRIVEHLRTRGMTSDLRHLLVIEEAHRLLSNVQKVTQDESSPRNKAVETFAHLLSEIRAYGQGVIIADQIPVKLIPDVIKNTSLKIAHRIVDLEDRNVLAGSMAMTDKQANILNILKIGQSAIFADGDDNAVLVQAPPIKDKMGEGKSDNISIAKHMTILRDLSNMPIETVCGSRFATNTVSLVEKFAFKRDANRLILSAYEDDNALDRYWNDILMHINSVRRPKDDNDEILRCLVKRTADWYAYHRGDQSGWSYANTNDFRDKIHRLLSSYANHENITHSLTEFRDCADRLHVRPFPPYSYCDHICLQNPPVCLYRYAVADLIATKNLAMIWNDALKADQTGGGERHKTWEVCLDAAQILIGNLSPPEVVRRAGLCYGLQMLHTNIYWLPDVRIHFMMKLVSIADKWVIAQKTKKN